MGSRIAAGGRRRRREQPEQGRQSQRTQGHTHYDWHQSAPFGTALRALESPLRRRRPDAWWRGLCCDPLIRWAVEQAASRQTLLVQITLAAELQHVDVLVRAAVIFRDTLQKKHPRKVLAHSEGHRVDRYLARIVFSDEAPQLREIHDSTVRLAVRHEVDLSDAVHSERELHRLRDIRSISELDIGDVAARIGDICDGRRNGILHEGLRVALKEDHVESIGAAKLAERPPKLLLGF